MVASDEFQFSELVTNILRYNTESEEVWNGGKTGYIFGTLRDQLLMGAFGGKSLTLLQNKIR